MSKNNSKHINKFSSIREGLGRILAIDYGEKRIGLALADEETKIAIPYLILENRGWKDNLAEIKNIIEQEEIIEVVVGLPLSLSGGESAQTKETRKFFDLLKDNLALLVVWEDERLSSREVDSLVKKFGGKVDRDAVAAMLILQSFLDKQGK